MAGWGEDTTGGWKTGGNENYWRGSSKPFEATDDVNFTKTTLVKPNGHEDNANGHDSNDQIGNGANGGDFGNADYGGGGGGSGDGCRNCGQEGHFARECPEPKKNSGECYNCGEAGHNKADCTNPRVVRPFTGTCRICNQEGHPAAECPDKGPEICRNCQQEGHKASECEANRALDYAGVPDMDPAQALALLKKASADRDMDDFKEALKMYTKTDRALTYETLERKFRAAGFTIYLIAIERELPVAMASVNLQGKSGCKYVIGFYFDPKPKRAKFAEGWPSSPEENMERLKDAGLVMEQVQPVCRNCEQLGHISKNCTEEKVEVTKEEITCSNCSEVGHRQRDCPQARQVRGACKNCGQPGHKASDCTEPRSAAGVECRKCSEIGHFSKDCPNSQGGGGGCRNCGEEGHMAKECEKPKNPDMVICRNCDKMGHFSRDCPEPKDWSRVKCSNCGEMGHTIKRCKAPIPEGDAGFDNAGGFDGGAAAGNAGGFDSAGAGAGGFGEAPAAASGDWNTGAASGGGGW